MNCEQREDLIIKYFEQELDKHQSDELKRHIEECSKCQEMFHQYEDLYKGFVDPISIKPEASLNDNFEKILQQEIENQDSNKTLKIEINRATLHTVFKYAAVLIIGLFIGFMVNNNKGEEEIAVLQKQVEETRNLMVLAMLQNDSPSSRMHAVSMTSESKSNMEIINALIQTFQNDANVNVRLAALNALYNYRLDENIQQIFLHSLTQDNDPRIQIRLIDILVEIDSEKAVPEFYKMLQDNDLNTVVKYKIEEGLGILL